MSLTVTDDSAGVGSTLSNVLVVSPPVNEPPASPSGLIADWKKKGKRVTGVRLSWTANQESDLAGYRVYRSATAGGAYIQVGTSNGNSFTDSSITSGEYYYVVTALDSASNESGYSNEATIGSSTSGGGGGGGGGKKGGKKTAATRARRARARATSPAGVVARTSGPGRPRAT